MLRSLAKSISVVSVRTRIIGLALIPVFGFLANGITFTSGQTEVTDAFANVGTASALADASREFKIALATMQIAAKDFVSHPSSEPIKSFEAGQTLAATSFDRIAAAARAFQDSNTGLVRQKLGELKLHFDYLTQEQEALGFTDDQGTRKSLEEAAAKVETVINDGMVWLSDSERQKLLISLVTMRRYEAQYRLNPTKATWELYFKEYRTFEQGLRDLPGDSELKNRLSDRVKEYSSTLAQWNRHYQNLQTSLTDITDTTQQLVPHSHTILAMAQQRASAAST